MHRFLVGSSALALGLVGLAAPATANTVRSTVVVQAGGSIQAALDAAAPGSTIVLSPGTYAQNLWITKPVTLRGRAAAIVPPATPAPNPCLAASESGQATGICITGTMDANHNITARLPGVRLIGLRVAGFAGDGVFAFGTSGLWAQFNDFADNGGYGIFALNSTGTVYLSNRAHGNGDAGFYIGESPTANAYVSGNVGYDNRNIGLLFRDSLGATITGNRFWGNCAGLVVVDTGVPGAAGNARITRNVVTDNDRVCPAAGEEPPLTGIGIALVGATHARVDRNWVVRNVPGAPATITAGGISVITAAAIGGAVASSDVIDRNIVLANQPADLVSDGTGIGITFTRNWCATSSPAGLCH